MILDGWGVAPCSKGNAISNANPIRFNQLRQTFPYTELNCSGNDVGLPQGQMGNSEVGHLNIGAGRVVYQEITRITNAIENGSFFENKALLEALDHARNSGGALHLMGLLSDGGVHSHIEHLYALLKMCHANGLQRVLVHAFLDGRDVGPKSAEQYLTQLEQFIKNLGVGKIATITGRFYAMDRDNRWERVERAYRALTLGEGIPAANAAAAITASYEARVTDEFVEPVIIVDGEGKPVGTINDGDSIIFFNFRADRAREITRAFVDHDFDHFQRLKWPGVHYVCMTQYDITIEAPVAYGPQNLDNTLGEVLAEHGLRQLRIAETEKYAHVTFFFNGGVEEPNPNEDRILIPSPAVATYNMKPEMSAIEVTEKVLTEIARDYYQVIIMNYANPDMVGHTGILDAAVTAIKTVDNCLQQVVDAILAKDGIVLVTADHGNSECMICPDTGGPFTAHTTNRVPFILASNAHIGQNLRQNGALCDIAPTLLKLIKLPVPEEMTGTSLLIENHAESS